MLVGVWNIWLWCLAHLAMALALWLLPAVLWGQTWGSGLCPCTCCMIFIPVCPLLHLLSQGFHCFSSSFWQRVMVPQSRVLAGFQLDLGTDHPPFSPVKANCWSLPGCLASELCGARLDRGAVAVSHPKDE